MTPPPPRDAVKKVLASLADLPAEAERELQTVEELKVRVRKLEHEARTAKPEAELRAMEQRHAEEMRRVRTAAKRAVEMLAGIPQAVEATREFIAPIAGDEVVPPKKRLPEGFSDAGLVDMHWKEVDGPGPFGATSNGHEPEPNKGERRLLIAIAQYPNGITTETLAVLTGYKATSRRVYLQRLVSGGFVERDGKRFRATEAGLRDLGTAYQPLPVGDKLRGYWMTRLPDGERKLLGVAVDAYPRPVTAQSLQEATSYKPTSVRVYSQRLVSRQLLIRERGELRAARELFG
jgi:hypothetical protein